MNTDHRGNPGSWFELIRTLLALATNMVVLACLIAGNTAAGIGVYARPNPSCPSCEQHISIPPLVSTPIYVVYSGGAPRAWGAEYRISGLGGVYGVNFIATLIAAPGSNLNLGNAFDGIGHNVAWPEPQDFDANGNLLLATYQILLLSAPATDCNQVLTITNRNPPTNFSYPCPLIVDAGLNYLCMSGGTAWVNRGDCPVTVEARTWTQVRNLYR
jgi:hypothetical protein